MPFRFRSLHIAELILIEAQSFEDDRGAFAEVYKKSEFSANGIPEFFVQDNLSYSVQGVLRGLHYQKRPKAQGKLVRVCEGEVFDVAVDIREGSRTYAKWASVLLSAASLRMLYIPPGFAHGFCVLSERAQVTYKATEEHAPELERGIVWNDPQINIQWPVTKPILSPRDSGLPALRDADNNFRFEQSGG